MYGIQIKAVMKTYMAELCQDRATCQAPEPAVQLDALPVPSFGHLGECLEEVVAPAPRLCFILRGFGEAAHDDLHDRGGL